MSTTTNVLLAIRAAIGLPNHRSKNMPNAAMARGPSILNAAVPMAN
ncbi:hypothetical protein AB0O76_43865 [Streptomyces sp. NPDC086554]